MTKKGYVPVELQAVIKLLVHVILTKTLWSIRPLYRELGLYVTVKGFLFVSMISTYLLTLQLLLEFCKKQQHKVVRNCEVKDEESWDSPLTFYP